jgi:hypothetical protein
MLIKLNMLLFIIVNLLLKFSKDMVVMLMGMQDFNL